MDNQPWLDSVREQLARHRLPPSYVQRFTEELSDHLEDLNENGLEADASSRLGEPKQVAAAAVAAYRRRSFLGRHPVAAFLVFAISPVMSMEILLFVSMFLQGVFSGRHTVNFQEDHWMLSLMVLVCSTFAGCLYGELAMWLGISRKWTLASCAVLGAIATLLELGFAGTVTVVLLVQFTAPLAVGWWFTKWKYSHRYPATTILVFAISPVASHLLLLAIVALVIATAQPLFSSPGGPANGHVALVVLAASLSVLIILLPAVVTSFLYCKLVVWFGIGRRWMLVSCAVLAMYIAVLFSRQAASATYATEGHGSVSVGLVMCLILGLGQALVPLAIAWWFMRRKHDQGQLELAS